MNSLFDWTAEGIAIVGCAACAVVAIIAALVTAPPDPDEDEDENRPG